ncbi:MAG: alcohol dehydrogenase [Cypionkella sp.]|uniref:zinc-binding dehydrogenase n=1 Tax=Cypionkella sp. TaxID=2811411 RepID=UPI00261B2935|nr:zinc-binding dehydrogenase [Cypionkella sp.]MDB5660518.1 alcohol dehydrogenase [Cypionkella sp.]
MQRATHSQFGSPQDVLSSEEADTPTPSQGQVLVRMVLSPVHNHDLMIIAGQYGSMPDLPAFPGTEAVGVVEALGEGVDNLVVGQRVAGGASQTWATFYLADAAGLVPVPDCVSDETACQLIAMPLSAKVLLDTLDVKPGDWIVQNAANGLVGKLVARFGAERGIKVLGLVRRKEAVAELRALGIDKVIATDVEGWADKAKELTGGAPVLRAVDSLGGDGAAQVLKVASNDAVLVSFGAMTEQPLKIAAQDLLFRGITVKGFWGAKPHVTPERIGQFIGELLQAAAAQKLIFPIEAAYDIEHVAEAARASAEPGRKGKVAIRGA